MDILTPEARLPAAHTIDGLGTCEVCGSHGVVLLRHSELHDFDVGRCPRCRMVYVLNPPAPSEVEERYVQGDNCDSWVEWQRDDDSVHRQALVQIDGLLALPEGRRPVLFDVGAGVGDFLALAQHHGFEVAGNEISPSAIEFSKQRHGFELSRLPLAEQEPESIDVVTMWCVVAHVPDPAAFVREAFEMLRPGGVLFLRTPRWCMIDTVAFAATKWGPRRVGRVADRRVTRAHLHLFNDLNMKHMLEAVGFSDVRIDPVCHYPLSSDAYLTTSGMGGRLIGRLAEAADALIDRRWFVRNAMLAYARRPDPGQDRPAEVGRGTPKGNRLEAAE